MNKILLIGAGQLGSRHLQGLAKIKIDANIFIVDPSSDSMNNAKIRLNEISDRNTRNGYYFYPTITEVPKDIDLAIIATNSDVRKKVLVDLFKNKNVKSIILEKFLFQNELDFFDIEKILIEKKN